MAKPSKIEATEEDKRSAAQSARRAKELVEARNRYNAELTKNFRLGIGADGKFEPGKPKTGGRKKGSLNKLPLQAKEAILTAVGIYGVNGTGEGGMAGFL